MKRDIIMIRGDQNSGKTRLMYAICSLLDLDGYSIGGMIQVPNLPSTLKTSYALSDQLTGISRTILDEECKQTDAKIGKFYIDQDAFDWANEQIIKSFKTSDYIIFDEIGKLEIQQKGFYPSFTRALDEYKGTIMMIVRDDFVDDVFATFNFNEQSVLSLSSSLTSEIAYNEVLNNE